MELRASIRQACAVILLLATTSTALTINAINSTLSGPFINLTVTAAGSSPQNYSIYPLTSTANLTGPQGIAGGSFFASSINDKVNNSNIVFISCDSYSGNLQAIDIFSSIETNYMYQATVFYSQTADSCQPSGGSLGSLGSRPVFSMTSASSSRALIEKAGQGEGVYIGANVTNPNGPNGSPGSDNTPPSAPTGTTLVMIILYSITGCITALFMFIVIGGAIKARRHMDRYGRQVVGGRVRQTRASGLARAMLDTIPIVKFGQREQSKDVGVELGETQAMATSTTPLTTIHEENDKKRPLLASNAVEETSTLPAETDGIAAADVDGIAPDHAQGCSICTEDFEVGQDQRVLPCDHRYHPACVDPWLLNVSATCPLCRIDLRPPEEQDDTAEVEEPVPPPPVVPASRRRSVFLAIAGLRRPEGMTREERIEALRRYRQGREQDEAAAPSPDATTSDVLQRPEAQTQNRALRLLNVRTWRTTARARRSPQG